MQLIDISEINQVVGSAPCICCCSDVLEETRSLDSCVGVVVDGFGKDMVQRKKVCNDACEGKGGGSWLKYCGMVSEESINYDKILELLPDADD